MINARPFKLRRQHRGPALALTATAALALAGLLYAGRAETQAPPDAPPPVPVRTIAAEQRDLPHELEMVGTVEALQEAVVRTQVDGVLTRILFAEGQFVRRGQLLATIDDRALQAALAASQAQLAREQAQLRAAELDLVRYEALVARDAVSRQQLDQQQAETAQLRAAVRLAEANVQTARVNLSHTRIVSPLSGRVGIRRVDAGNLVRMTDADGIVSIAQVDPISVLFPVPQAELDGLRESTRSAAGSMVEARSRDGAALFGRGRITAFDNALNPATGTAQVRALFTNGAERLAPGAFVSVRIRTGLTPGAVVLPAAAVRPGLQGHFVYRVRNATAQRVPVRLGHADDEVVAIASGVAPGDTIVSDGFSRLQDGAAVTLLAPAQRRPS